MGTFFLTSCEHEAIEASSEEVQIDDAQDAAVRDVTIFYNGKSFKTTEGGGQDIDLSVLDVATRKAYDNASAIHSSDEIHLFDTQEEYEAYARKNIPKISEDNDVANDNLFRRAWRGLLDGLQTNASRVETWGNVVQLFDSGQSGLRQQAILRDVNFKPIFNLRSGESWNYGLTALIRVNRVPWVLNNQMNYVSLNKPGTVNDLSKRLTVYNGAIDSWPRKTFTTNPGGAIYNRPINLRGGVSSFKYTQVRYWPN